MKCLISWSIIEVLQPCLLNSSTKFQYFLLMEECLLRYSKSSVVEVNDIGHGPFDRVTLADAFAIVKQALCH